MKRTSLLLLIAFIFAFSCFFFFEPSRAQTKSQGENLPHERVSASPEQGETLREVSQMIQNAKAAGANFDSRELLQSNAALTATNPQLDEVLQQQVVLDLNKPAIERLLQDNAVNDNVEHLALPLPDGQGGTVELELVKVNIFAPGFSVKTSSLTSEPINENLGVHYRGIVKGNERSLAAISIFDNEVMGFYSTEAEGNTVLGRLGGDNPTDQHVLYADKDLKVRSNFQCDTRDTGETLPASALQDQDASASAAAACVRIYIEANFDLFQSRGSIVNTTNYVTGFFNQSATLFSNEGIPISLSEVFVWNSPSPYTANDSKEQLEKFAALRTNFNGNLAHLVTAQSHLGGIAYRPGLCNSGASYAFSGVDPTYNNVPTYSWTVEVFTHETGHNLGSPHTQACFWNGNNTPIDGCVEPEGACARPGLPSSGTIMSYCHLAGVPISFTLGFGPQPRNVILNRFNNASCLSNCTSTCTYALSPASESFGSSGGNGSFTVSANAGCAWAAVSNVSWLTATGSASGNGSVSYTVAANTGAARTGTITVAGQSYTVTQSAAGGGGCQSTTLLVGQTINGLLATTDCVFNGTTRYVDVYNFNGTAGQQIAVSMNSLLFDTYLYLLDANNQTIGSDDDGGGSTNSRIPLSTGFFTLPATGSYTIYATSYSDSGLIGSVGPYSISLLGAPTCNYLLSPGSQSFTASGGSNSFSMIATSGCSWAAQSNATWITTGSSGTGGGTVSYTVAANTGAARTGTITVAGQTFTVTQSAGSGGGCIANSISGGQTINGTLTTNDCVFNGTTRYVDVYNFNGTAGQQIVVSMGSSTFDTYLYLLSAGNFIALDDDGGGGTNSRIPIFSGSFTLPATGSYTIYATSYSATGTTGSTGNYTLNLSGNIGGSGSTTGVFRPSNGIVYLKNSNTSGFSDINLIYGIAGDQPIAGDWDGNGTDTLGIYRNGTFYLRNSNSTGAANIVFAFGAPGDQPIAGDWDGNGSVTVGVYRQSTGVFYLRNSNTPGSADSIFVLGNPGDIAIAGDWDGDGDTTTGVFRPTNGIIYLKNQNVSGNADIYLVYGIANDLPLAGDWDGDGKDSIGIYRNGLFYLRNSNSQGFADLVFALGNNGDIPIAGDWNGAP